MHSASTILDLIINLQPVNWLFFAFFLVQRLQQFQGVFTLFSIKDGFGSLVIFKAPIGIKFPDDLSSSLGKRSEK